MVESDTPVFYYDLVSPFSYLAASHRAGLARSGGVAADLGSPRHRCLRTGLDAHFSKRAANGGR
jgi:hypothetical protein